MKSGHQKMPNQKLYYVRALFGRVNALVDHRLRMQNDTRRIHGEAGCGSPRLVEV